MEQAGYLNRLARSFAEQIAISNIKFDGHDFFLAEVFVDYTISPYGVHDQMSGRC